MGSVVAAFLLGMLVGAVLLIVAATTRARWTGGQGE